MSGFNPRGSDLSGVLAVLLLATPGCIAKRGEPEPEDSAPVAVDEESPTSPATSTVLPPLVAHACDPLMDDVPRLRVDGDGKPAGDPRPIQLLAELTDGRWLLVTRPAPGERDGRVFFGPPAAMLERGWWDDGRPKGRGPTSVRFVLGDGIVHARFPRACGPPNQPGRAGRHLSDCPGDLYVAGEPVRFDPRSPDDLSGLTFLCGTQGVRVSVDAAGRRAEQWLDDPAVRCSPDRYADPSIEFHQVTCRSADTDERLVRVDTRTGAVSLANG